MVEPIEGNEDIPLRDGQRAVDLEVVERGVEHTVREYMLDAVGHSSVYVGGQYGVPPGKLLGGKEGLGGQGRWDSIKGSS